MKRISTGHRIAVSLGLVALAMSMATRAWSAEVSAAPEGRPIRLGMSVSLTGSNAVVGRALAQGVKASLARIDAHGGIDGRPVSLVLMDDAGDPARTVANTRALLEQGVVALTSYQGTAGIEASMKLLDDAGVPLVGVASSAESLREPPRPWLFNLRAGASEEAAALIFQLDTVGINQVAVIGQADGLGRTAMEGVQAELMRIATRPVVTVTLPQGADKVAIAAGVAKVCAAPPASIVLAMSPATALSTIRAARGTACRRQFLVLSDVGADLAAMGATNEELAGMIVAQVLPSPRGNHILVQDARRDLARLDASSVLGYPQLEGYLAGRVLEDALRACGRKVSAACVLNSLSQRKLEIAGYRLQFGPDDRRGSRFVELTVIDAYGQLRR